MVPSSVEDTPPSMRLALSRPILGPRPLRAHTHATCALSPLPTPQFTAPPAPRPPAGVASLLHHLQHNTACRLWHTATYTLQVGQRAQHVV